MHGAPPVALVCEGGAVWRGVRAGLPALAAAAFAAWATGHAGLGLGAQALVALVAAVPVATLAWRSTAQLARTLAWDGEHWRLGPADEPGRVDVMIDLGGWLLLRHTGQRAGAATVWLAVSGAAAGAALHGLRLALQARAPTAHAGIDSPERLAR
jgi:hypothetical protein